MADDYVALNPDAAGKKIRTQSRTVGANSVHEQYTITCDEATGNAARVLNAVPASTDYGQVVRPVPVTRTQRSIYAQATAANAVTTEALISCTSVLNFTTGSTATTHTVTAGKTFHIQSITLGFALTASAANWGRINLRVNTGGTATATSPIAASVTVATQSTAVAGGGGFGLATYADGLWLPAGASFGISHVALATTAIVNFIIVGYEFS